MGCIVPAVWRFVNESGTALGLVFALRKILDLPLEASTWENKTIGEYIVIRHPVDVDTQDFSKKG
jgi:hypothetical protein